MLQKVILYLSILIFVFPGLSYLHAQEEDVEGSEDHPMITRYEGSHIIDYEQFSYDRQELVTDLEYDEFLRSAFEGMVTRIHYAAPEGRSEYEVHQNYKLALQNAGFDIIYECMNDDAQCFEIVQSDAPLGYDNVYRRGSHRHYSLARLENPDGDIYAAVHTARRHGENRNLLIILEEQPLETDKVQIDADARVSVDEVVKVDKEAEDAEGSEDHPMIMRYEGSHIIDHEQFSHDRQELVTGLEDREFIRTAFEGAVTRIHYEAPEGRSEYEVHQNYKLALQDAGFDIIYECMHDDAQCFEIVQSDAPLGYDNVYRRGNHRHYSLARLANPAGDIYVAVHTARRHGENRSMLIILEEQPMETGMVDVSVDAATMASDLADAGRVMIYGIHFDTGQADIKPESESTLTEIAELLNNNPDINLGVVGHTDAVGGLDANMDLSERRAAAVVEYLVSEYDISDERLSPHGVAFLAPEATNETEEGRAMNRRVELIRMPE